MKKGSLSETCTPVSIKKNTNVFTISLLFSVFERELWHLTFYKYSVTERWKWYKIFTEKNAINVEL